VITIPAVMQPGPEVSVAGNRILVVDPKGTIEPATLLALLEETIEPRLAERLREQEEVTTETTQPAPTSVAVQNKRERYLAGRTRPADRESEEGRSLTQPNLRTIGGRRGEKTGQGMVSIRPLKDLVVSEFPETDPLRTAILADRDVLKVEEFLSKLEVWFTLVNRRS